MAKVQALDYDVDKYLEEQGYDDHFHEHEHGDKYKVSFISKYIFSTDHKIIAKQYLITGIVWAFIGAFFSLIFRLQLGYPDMDLSWLRPILGGWININSEGVGSLSPDFYYAMVTIHGTVLVFFVLTAGLSGTFSNFLIPLQIGARDMASPFLNMLSYWFFFLASVIMLLSLFLESGPFAGGWVAYPPLSALPQAMMGSGMGMNLWLFSLVFFVVSVLLGGLNYITTVINLRTKGMSFWRLPLTVWSFFVTAIIGLLSFPVLVGGFVLLLLDRLLGTSFYLSDIFIAGEPLHHVGGSPILYQHLFWFLGHPEVYIIILPAMGIVSEVMSTHARRPIFGYKAMVYSIIAIGFLSFLVWAHHMFVSGMDPFLANFFILFTLIIAVPSAVKVFNWITTLYKGNIHLTVPMLFAIGFVSFFISGGLTGLYLGNAPIDIQMHDTYFVVAHFHIVMGVAAFFGMFAGVYHWFPKMFGRYMNQTLGKIHFWLTLIAAYMVFWPMHYLGVAGVPRRYYTFDSFVNFSQFDTLNQIITIFAFVGFTAQLLFAFNFFYSIFYGKKVSDRNPYRANTLEWSAPTNPGHGNWPGKLPVVHRWPYDFHKNGSDYRPQYVPLDPDERDVH